MRLWFLIILALVAAGCGGGTGTEAGTLVTVPQRATVAVAMADESSEDMGGVYVTFTKVSLVPEGGGDPVVLFESMTGEEVNFSNLDNEELLFSVNDDVETGTYAKILVAVESIRVVGGPCEDLTTTVQDDEIELVPEDPIEIAAGDKIVIQLAMNSSQSVQIELDSASETCVFEPMVNVSVALMSPPEAQDCPTSATGTVDEILLNIQNEIIGFALDLGEGSDPQNVMVGEDTGVFGTDGLPTSANTIRLGDELTAKGRLDEEGDMLADVVIAGEVITFSATVIGAPDRGVVRVMPDVGEAVTGETNVRLFDGTLILFDCQDATAAALTKGAKLTITGKVAPDDEVFLAAEVEVDPVVIVGSLTACIETDEGFEIKVLPVGVAIEQTIAVPSGVGIKLAGDGTIPKDLLSELLACEPLPVRVSLGMEDGGNGDGTNGDSTAELALEEGEIRTASDVRVSAESIKGEVDRISAGQQLVLVDETLISVLDTATIVDLRDGESLASLSDVMPGDCVRVFGLHGCDDDPDADFYAFVMLVLENDDDKPEPPSPIRFEGCGQGYWKNHVEAWPAGYAPDDLFGDIFEDAFPGKTLYQVLWQGGGGVRALGRHAVAALLNAAADDIHYRFTEREVVGMFDDAVSEGGHVEWTKRRFELNNELGCRDDDDRRDDDEHDDDDDDRRT